MWDARLAYMIRIFDHKLPNYMLENIQRKLTIVIKSMKKMYMRYGEKIAYIENNT